MERLHVIKVMQDKCLNEIQILDKECFNRDKLRSIDNLKSLLKNNQNGCFTISENRKIAGYIFTRVLGNAGYIGPLGVNSEFRNKGYGKLLVKKGTEALINTGCKYIGLEVLPELGNNIGLYLKERYIPAFSTITYKKIIPYKQINDCFVINGKNIELNSIEEFNYNFKVENDDYSLLQDIILARSQKNSNIYFYKQNTKIIGFLCYSPLINPFVWGAFLQNSCEKSIFSALFSRLENDNNGKELRIRINSRYRKQLEVIDSLFIVERSTLRMMKKGFEGKFMLVDESGFVARPWIS